MQIKQNKFSQFFYILSTFLVVCTLALNSIKVSASDDDPLEPMNRVIFNFNEVVDDNILEPIAKGYRYVTPDPVENSVTNFFNNLGEINTIVNSALQMKLDKTVSSSSRLVINSTVGVLGLFDVASSLGIPHKRILVRPWDFMEFHQGPTLFYHFLVQVLFVMLPDSTQM